MARVKYLNNPLHAVLATLLTASPRPCGYRHHKNMKLTAIPFLTILLVTQLSADVGLFEIEHPKEAAIRAFNAPGIELSIQVSNYPEEGHPDFSQRKEADEENPDGHPVTYYKDRRMTWYGEPGGSYVSRFTITWDGRAIVRTSSVPLRTCVPLRTWSLYALAIPSKTSSPSPASKPKPPPTASHPWNSPTNASSSTGMDRQSCWMAPTSPNSRNPSLRRSWRRGWRC